MDRLKDKVAIVTGAEGGMRKAIVNLFEKRRSKDISNRFARR